MLEAIKEHPIIILAVIALVLVIMITIERLFTLFISYRLRVKPFKKALEEALVEMDLNKALRIASISPNHPVCKVARAGLMKANAGDKDLVRAMEVAQLEAMPRVTGFTPFLAMLGNLGTLLGLIVAIPGTFFATMFGWMQERLVDNMEETSLTVASHISQANREAKLRAQTGR